MLRVRSQLELSDFFLSGLRGSQIVIAVLDSGVSLHPDLSDRILSFRDFSGRREKNGRKTYYHTPYDEYGHGTHVCGILCGTGKLSGGVYRGIYPEGGLVVGKVLDRQGEGSAEDMLKGLEWILEQQGRYEIRLLNISVGISGLKDREKEARLKEMLVRLTDRGILVVCAAGNKGPQTGSLSSLGDLPQVISVGCHDGRYYQGDPRRCEAYSGRGRAYGTPRKPDVVAPGTCIWSCSSFWRLGRRGSQYEERSGTSMAAPIVTGCLARALQVCPGLTPKQLRKLLTGTAKDLGEPWNKQGWGMVQPKRLILEAQDFQKISETT